MKLTDFSPRWLSPDVFIFKNPTGGTRWLSCKRVLMSSHDQFALFRECDPGLVIVSTNPDIAWDFKGEDFATLTITPSIDASPSGNWHGCVTNGECV